MNEPRRPARSPSFERRKEAPPRPPRPPRPEAAGEDSPFATKGGEQKIYGKHACLSFYRKNPDRIIKGWLTDETAKGFGDLMKFCAVSRRAYHVALPEELEKVTGSIHHEGICLLVKSKRPYSTEGFLKSVKDLATCCVVAVDEVGNPHNLGAVMRVAAHFSARAVISPDATALQSGAAVRTAQGGAEYVDVVGCETMPAAIAAFHKEGFKVLTTSSHDGVDVFKTKIPARCLIVLGSEARGLHPVLLRTADTILRIPGTGQVESLNVATAASVILGEFWRQHGEAARFREANHPRGDA